MRQESRGGRALSGYDYEEYQEFMNQVMKQNYPIIVDGYADFTMAGEDGKQYTMEAQVEFYVDSVLDILNYVSQY